MASYIETENYGSYASIDALWAAHPEGGVEGAYCTINDVKYHWNKYDRMWVVYPNFGPTPARIVTNFDGDVLFQNNVTVAGDLRAKRIKQPCLGLFASSDALEAKWPDPEVGMWALVGNSMSSSSPAAVYRCDTEGIWAATGGTATLDGVEFDINPLYDAIITIYNFLGEYAFPNGKPTIDWSGTYASIMLELSNVTSSNAATSAERGSSYTTTLTGAHSSNNLYIMDVIVKMGGIDITSTAYNESTGVVSIAEVTGSIEITASEFTYVSDGLVLHLDGKNRGGTSGHWVSLVDYNGTPIDFTLTNCDETHDSYVAGNGTTSKGIGSVDTLDVSPSSGTIEAVYNGGELNNDTLCIMHNRGSSSVNHIGLASWHRTSPNYTSDDNLITIGMGTYADSRSKIAAKYTKAAIITGGYVSCIYNSFLVNGLGSEYYEGSSQNADSTSMLSIFYRKTSANERYFKYNLYSIRVYSRQLTDAERAQNKRVDKKRFNLI